jgi:AbrB family looped-hinge helix DNA binding protein
MLTAKVTSKGQITIPKKVRDKLGIQTGEHIGFDEKNGDFYIRKSVKKSPFHKWIGRLKTLKGKDSDEIIKELRGS